MPEGACLVPTCEEGACGSGFAPATTICEGDGVCDASGGCAKGTPAWTMLYASAIGRLATSSDRTFYYGDLLDDHDFFGTTLTSQGWIDGFLAELGAEGQQLSVIATAAAGEDTIQDAVVVADGVLTAETWTSETGSGIRVTRRGFDGQTTVLRHLTSGPYESFGFRRPRIAVSPNGDIALVGAMPNDLLFLDGQPLGGLEALGYALVFDAAGNLRWSRIFVGSESGDFDAVFDRDGNLVVAAPYLEAMQIGEVGLSTPLPNEYATFIVTLDAVGNVAWASSLSRNTASEPVRLAASPDGGVAVMGGFDGGVWMNGQLLFGEAGYFGFVLRLAPDGSLAWKHLEKQGPFGNGDIAFDPSGNLAICTTERKDADPVDPGFTPKHDLHLTKLAPAGEVLWTKRYGSDEPHVPDGAAAGVSCDEIAVRGETLVVTGSMVGDIDLGSPVAATKSTGALNAFVAAFSP